MPLYPFFKKESSWYYGAGLQSIPPYLKKEVDSDTKPYVVAYHYKIDPDLVRSWDNESIVKAFYALVRIGVIK